MLANEFDPALPVVVLLGTAFPLWAIVDAISRSALAFYAEGSIKSAWIIVLLVFTFVLGIGISSLRSILPLSGGRFSSRYNCVAERRQGHPAPARFGRGGPGSAARPSEQYEWNLSVRLALIPGVVAVLAGDDRPDPCPVVGIGNLSDH
jgi:hypothetical protein